MRGRFAHADDPSILLVRIGMHDEQNNDAARASDRLPAVSVGMRIGTRQRMRVALQHEHPSRQRQPMPRLVFRVLRGVPNPNLALTCPNRVVATYL